jgi:starvation-inducible DNA-binding protein
MANFIGLDDNTIKLSTNELSKLLANTYLLYLKTQNYHWNVTGENFQMWHLLFEKQYEELADAVDAIAERIRMLGQHTPASFTDFLALATISEKDKPRSADEMINVLLDNHDAIIVQLRYGLKALEETDDEGNIDFFIQRLREHEKIAWMLRSHIKSK